MDLLKKIGEAQEAYENLNAARKARIETIQKTQEEIEVIDGQMKKIEGSFDTLVQLAKEIGVLDKNGNPVVKEADENGTSTEGDEAKEEA